MRKAIAIVLVGLLLLCATAFAAANTPAASAARDAKPLVGDAVNLLLTNQPFAVSLSENPSTGYAWSVIIAGEGIEQIGEETDAKDTGLVGAPSNRRWIFRANKAGNATLTFDYERSWETGVAPAQTVAYKVRVLDAAKANVVKKNRTFTVTLEENPSTGYAWSFEANPAFKLIGTKTIEPKGTDIGLVGAPVKKVWTFRAVQKGVFTLKFAYARSWEKGVAPEKTSEYIFFVK